MSAVVIVSKNQDFTDVAAGLIQKELGVTCHIAEDKAQSKQWPEALVITDEHLPVRMQELLNNIRNSLVNSDQKWMIGEWELSARLKTLSSSGISIDLTDKEVQLLQCLVDAGKQGMDRDELLKRVWGFEPDINTHTLETHIYRLRAKLRDLSGKDDVISVSNGKYRLGCNG